MSTLNSCINVKTEEKQILLHCYFTTKTEKGHPHFKLVVMNLISVFARNM